MLIQIPSQLCSLSKCHPLVVPQKINPIWDLNCGKFWVYSKNLQIFCSLTNLIFIQLLDIKLMSKIFQRIKLHQLKSFYSPNKVVILQFQSTEMLSNQHCAKLSDPKSFPQFPNFNETPQKPCMEMATIIIFSVVMLIAKYEHARMPQFYKTRLPPMIHKKFMSTILKFHK